MKPMTREDIEDVGFRRIVCRRCNYHGWSDDCGACPRCVAREEDHTSFDTPPDDEEETP